MTIIGHNYFLCMNKIVTRQSYHYMIAGYNY